MSNAAATDVEQTSPYAGFWRRAIALLFDTFALLPPTISIVFMFNPNLAFALMDLTNMAAYDLNGLGGVSAVVLAVMYWCYFALMESSSWQATLGKRIAGIIVTDLEGRRVSFGAASIRAWPMYLSSAVSGISFLLEGVVAVIAALSCLAVAFTPRKQGLHDMMAGCLVVPKSTDFGQAHNWRDS